ncbi:MAG: hypothetical protein JSU94_06760 [Phycisphaerales bacterium]|nr:MAG: hypothetical protein JSU94_06760 [Phycisphaerales bacterium]
MPAAGVTVESDVWLFCVLDRRFSRENRPEGDAHTGLIACWSSMAGIFCAIAG